MSAGCCPPGWRGRVVTLRRGMRVLSVEDAKILVMRPGKKVELLVEDTKGNLRRIVSRNEDEASFLFTVGLRRIMRDLTQRFRGS